MVRNLLRFYLDNLLSTASGTNLNLNHLIFSTVTVFPNGCHGVTQIDWVQSNMEWRMRNGIFRLRMMKSDMWVIPYDSSRVVISNCIASFHTFLPASVCELQLSFRFQDLIFHDKRTSASSCLKLINHVKLLPLSLEIFLFLSKLIYFNWILIDLEIEHEKMEHWAWQSNKRNWN